MRLATLTAALVAVPLLVPQPASACSKRPIWAPLGDRMVFFTGTAMADTLRTGPGSVRYGVGDGHFARAVDRQIYGQVVAVDALGGRALEGSAAGVTEVVVVPWDYDSSCRPLAWGRSARWVEPGTEGLYIAELRAPEQWVDGRPTVDLHNPSDLPYTTAERLRGMLPPETPLDSMLTPAQLFELYRALPSRGEVEENGTAALGPMREWIERNPELARRAPVDWLVGSVVSIADRVELSRRDHPVHGTWRFEIRLPDGSARIVYGRTDPRSVNRWSSSGQRFQWTPEQLLPPSPEGIELMVILADALDELSDTDPMGFSRGGLSIVSGSDPSTGEDSRWAGRIDYSFLSAALGRRPVVHQAFLEENERNRAIYLAGSPYPKYPMPATFTRDPAGVLRVRQSYPLPGGEEVVVEGEQLSREVLRQPG